MKIAFCFLLMNTLDTERKWVEFFENADPELYSVYAHIKTPTSKSPKWMKHVKTVETSWCGYGIVNAVIQLYKEALKESDHVYFCLLSNSCVPLYSFDDIYKRITSSKKSRIDIERKFRTNGYFGSLWSILNRKCAKDAIRLSNKQEKKVQNFLKNHKERYRSVGIKFDKKGSIISDNLDAECPKNMACHCPDETYLINWFVTLYGRPSTPLFKKHILNTETTFVHWDDSISIEHPITFNRSNLKKYINKMYSGDALFARKFTSSASMMIHF